MAAQTLKEILENAERVEVEPALDQLIGSFLEGISAAYDEYPELAESGVSFKMAVAALFDLCVNALYARSAVSSGWVYCAEKSAALSNSHYGGTTYTIRSWPPVLVVR